MSRTSRWFLAAMLIAAPLVAGDEFNKNMSGTVPYRGGRVMIVHRFGSVRVHTTTANEVTARATVHSSDAELGKMFRFSVTNTDDGVVVRTSVPQFHMRGDEDGSWSADVEVTVPERAPVLLRNSFGSIEVTGLRAPAEIINRQGSIDAKDIRGGRIETAFGSINLEGSEGDTTLRNANGAINASDVRGQLTITNRFGSVTVRSVDKGLSIANSNAAVSAVDVKGPTSISNSFASTEARNIGGPTSIASQNGNVTAADISGDLSVATRFGLVKAEHIRGSLSVDNSNGGVTASDINGDAHVKTSFASVFLKGIEGSVDVENQNGAIGVSELRGGCNDVSLRTTYAPIRIALGPNASYTVRTRTTYGTIETEVPYTVTSRSSSETSTSESAVIGKGQCHMELVTSNGGIRITQE